MNSTAKRLFHFAVTGGIGFIADVILFTLFSQLTDSLIVSRVLAFSGAVVTTFTGNRMITFSDREMLPVLPQFASYFLSCCAGGAVNLLCFAVLLNMLPVYIAFTVGVLAGMIINYLLSNLIIFKQEKSKALELIS